MAWSNTKFPFTFNIGLYHLFARKHIDAISVKMPVIIHIFDNQWDFQFLNDGELEVGYLCPVFELFKFIDSEKKREIKLVNYF